MSDENLWGELPVDDKPETPASILRTQAVALNKATKGLLDARIVQGSEGENFTFDFRIIAPALGNYSANIFSVEHPITLYPLRVRAEEVANWGSKEAKNREEFTDLLKKILQGDRVRRTVSGLLAQSHEASLTASSAHSAVAGT